VEELILYLLWLAGQFLLELLVQLIGQLLVEVCFRSIVEAFKRPPASPALAALGHFLLGAAAGGISLFGFPALFIRPMWAQWLNLLLTPIVAGGAMAGLGWIRQKKGQTVIRLETFAYGSLFAFSMALVRFLW